MKNEKSIHSFRIGANIIEIFDENDFATMENELEAARVKLKELRAAEKEERRKHLEEELNNYILHYGDFSIVKVDDHGYSTETHFYSKDAVFIPIR